MDSRSLDGPIRRFVRIVWFSQIVSGFPKRIALQGLKIANRRFEPIRASRAHVMKIGVVLRRNSLQSHRFSLRIAPPGPSKVMTLLGLWKTRPATDLECENHEVDSKEIQKRLGPRKESLKQSGAGGRRFRHKKSQTEIFRKFTGNFPREIFRKFAKNVSVNFP